MSKNVINEMTLIIKALSCNEGFARSSVAAFAVGLNPTLEQINDIKTAVSEAVTNCVVHGYDDRQDGDIRIECRIIAGALHITISDDGIGIKDISKARQPFFTSKPEQERSGMGFTVMESFMDTLEVENNENGGLRVIMIKKIGAAEKSA
jgi:stage II sporulation protein AB (anti-sigma F factor)